MDDSLYTNTISSVSDPENESLPSLMNALKTADESLEEFDIEKHKELIEKTEIKVDSYKYMLIKMKSRCVEISEEIEELQKIKKTLENKQKNLKELVLFHMKSNGYDKLPGVKYVANLIKKKQLIVNKLPEANSEMFIKWPKLIKKTYAWNKTDVKNQFKSDPECGLKDYIEETQTSHIEFRIKKGLD